MDDVRPLEFLLYLYFGKTEEDLKKFALRDLGIVRTNTATSFKARFTDEEEARACFHYSRLLDRLKVKSASIYRDVLEDIFGGPDCPVRGAWVKVYELLAETMQTAAGATERVTPPVGAWSPRATLGSARSERHA